jgi:hypothetical protein
MKLKQIIAQESAVDEPKKELNPRLFVNEKLTLQTRRSLLELFEILIKNISIKGFDQYIVQRVFVGGLCGFQWSDSSDIDLHLIINDEELAQDKNLSTVELSKLLNDSIERMNKKYYFRGYPVEFYIQGRNEKFFSNGIYDVELNTWDKYPEVKEYNKENVNQAKLEAKEYKIYIFSKIKEIKKQLKKNKDEQFIKACIEFIDKEKEKIKNLRKQSISKETDSTVENMFFIFLRRGKVFQKIKEFKVYLQNYLINTSDHEKENTKKSKKQNMRSM